jgi:hypothetical protein
MPEFVPDDGVKCSLFRPLGIERAETARFYVRQVKNFPLEGAICDRFSPKVRLRGARQTTGDAGAAFTRASFLLSRVIAGSGALAGVAAGAWLGSRMIGLYNEYWTAPHDAGVTGCPFDAATVPPSRPGPRRPLRVNPGTALAQG